MRFAVTVMVATLAISEIAIAAPPRIEDAIARAAALGKPLVIEYGATWCAPCRVISRDVMPRPDVQAALRGIEFVHYDIDTSPGDLAAQRYRIQRVPLLVIVASDGTEVVRRTPGGSADHIAKQVIELLHQARDRTPSTADLEAAVAARPDDIEPRRRLARHYAATDRRPDAIVQLRAILAIPSVDRRLAAETTAAIDDLAAAEARLQHVVDAALAFVNAFPESPLASKRLAILAASGRVEASRLAELAHAHLAAVAVVDLPDAVRAASLAGALDDARLATERAPDLERRFLEAELELGRNAAFARNAIAALCKPPPRDYEHRCFALTSILQRGKPASPGIERLATHAREYVQALEDPAAHAIVSDVAALDDQHRELGNTIARAIDQARQRCSEHVVRNTYAMLFFDFTGSAPAITVRLHDERTPHDSLDDCLEAQLRDQSWPKTTRSADQLWTMIALEKHRDRDSSRQSSSITTSLVAFGNARAGSLDTGGIGAHVTVELARYAILQGELEIGGTAAPNYVLRGLIGLRVGDQRTIGVVSIGIGGSRFGDRLDDAFEVPVEVRARLLFGPVRGHLWGRFTMLRGAPDRDRATPWDEASFGIAASVPFGRVRVLFGAAMEQREVGVNALFTVGLPIRSYF